MKHTLYASLLIFSVTLISIAGLQVYQGGERVWMRESEGFHNMINRISEGVAFCYSGDSTTTCWAVTKDGWYITAGHKVNRDFPEANKLYVKLERKRDAKVFEAVRIIPPPSDRDLLLFKIDHKPKYYFKDFKEPVMHEENWVIGFRGRSGKSLSPPGYITFETSEPLLLRSTARMTFGLSGSPVINRRGQVLGVAIMVNVPSLDCLFVPGSHVEKYIKDNLKQ